MSLKSKFKTSAALIEKGVWFPVTVNADKTECRVKLRRNGRSNRHWTNAFREHTAGVDTENLTPEEDEAITIQVFVDSVLLEWENLQPEDDGVNLEFNKENALKLLSDPDWLELLKDWQAKSNQLTAFQPKLEKDAKN